MNEDEAKRCIEIARVAIKVKDWEKVVPFGVKYYL